MTRVTEMPLSSAWCLRCGHRYDHLPQGLCWQEVVARGLEQTCAGPVIQFFARVPDPESLLPKHAGMAPACALTGGES